MLRIIKHPEIRREELLGIAARLFGRHGYDATSIDAIIGEAKLSKGAFYHHYRSKDALLEALAARAAKQALERLREILADADMTAVQRLSAFLKQGRRREEEQSNVAVFSTIFRPENLALYHRLHTAVTRVMLPPLVGIVEQGVREGTMKSDHPVVTAEIVLILGTITHDAVADLIAASDEIALSAALATFQIRLEQQGIAVDRTLGLPDGTITLWDPAFRDQWLQAMSTRSR